MKRKNRVINICVAAGSEFIKAGLFSDGVLSGFFKMPSSPVPSSKKISESLRARFERGSSVFKGGPAVLAASVSKNIAAPAAAKIRKALAKTAEGFGWRFVEAPGTAASLPFSMDYAGEEGPGADRVCCAAAAVDRFAGESGDIVIIDFGTATRFTLVSKGSFRGGLVIPGFAAFRAAMGLAEEYLFRVHFNRIAGFLGRDEAAERIAGVYGGYPELVNGVHRKLLADARADAAGACVVTTGGYSSFFTTWLDFPVINDQTLELCGIDTIVRKYSGPNAQ